MSGADDFTADVTANGQFGAAAGDDDGGQNGGGGASAAAATSEAAASSAIPKGTDDNVAEDRKLFVGGLSWETREPQIKEYFEQFGEIESVNLKLDPNTGKSRCFAFVVYKQPCDLEKVFGAQEHAINSKKVDVKKARAKPGKIFVGGLKAEMTDDQIREHFAQYGKIIEFEMPQDKVRKVRKGFGFITFEREETMKELIKKMKVKIGEHEVDLRKATPKPEMGGGGGGGGPFRQGGGYGGYGPPPMGDYGGGYGAQGGYGDYYGGGGGYGAQGGFGDYGGGAWGGASPWGGYGGGYGAPGGGKMMRGRGGMSKRGGAPY